MTDWEVEALNEDEAFFQLISYIPFLKNTHLLFSLFCLFSFLLETLLCVSAYCFLGEGEKLCMSDRVPRFFISLYNYKRQHSWPPTFCRQIWADLISHLAMLDNS